MFKDTHLQWFGDPDPGVPDIEFEADQDVEEEIEIVEEGVEEVPDPNAPKPKTTEEYEAEIAGLRGQADQNTALRQAVEGLGERIGTPAAASSPAPTAPVIKDDSALKEKFNADVFADNPYGVIRTLVEEVAKDIAGKQVNQVAGAFAGTMVKNQKAMLRADPKDGPLYTEYEKEVEQEVANLIAQNPVVKNNPELYQYAFGQVKTKNIDTIAQKLADKILAEKSGTTESKAKVQFSERSTGGAGQKPKTKKVVITKSEERYCDLRGLPVTQFAKMKADGASFNLGGELIYE